MVTMLVPAESRVYGGRVAQLGQLLLPLAASEVSGSIPLRTHTSARCAALARVRESTTSSEQLPGEGEAGCGSSIATLLAAAGHLVDGGAPLGAQPLGR